MVTLIKLLVNASGVSEYILETDNLRKSFGNLVANDGISLGVERGEIHGIIGPNGSGKTTFFNTVSGFFKPDSGTVTFNGTDITGQAPDAIARQGLARTFQIASPFSDLTVRENLLGVYTEGLRSGLRIPKAKKALADSILNRLEIDHIANHEASDISGGQQKLLELGRILMLDPDCIMLDEPTAGVNPALQERILGHLRELNDEGTSFVIIEHDMSVIKGTADRVTVLNQGQIVTQGDFDEVTSDERVRTAYLGGRTDHDAGLEQTIASSRTAETEGVSPDSVGTGGTQSAVTEQIDIGETEPNKLVASNVVTGYGNHTVIDGVSIESHPDITCIFGPNGSGKSTLMKALIGAVPVWEGAIRYGEHDITTASVHENLEAGLVMLPQDGGIFGTLTVRENLLLGGYRVSESERRRERMDTVFEAFPILEEKQGDPANSLSGGQQMMLSFARAMMTGADMFLLDEPTSGLAPTLIDDVFDMIDVLLEQDAQVILIEQNVREALRIADHVYILAQGQLQFDGEPSELLDDDDLVELYLGLD